MKDVRFWSKVDVKGPDDCWEWLAFKHKGYGQYRVGGVKQPASRVALEGVLHRPLLPTEFACHTCDNPGCVNPSHLYAGSAAENSQDAVRRGRLRPMMGAAKLTPADVAMVKAGLSEGLAPKVLAQQFGLTDAAIRDIRAGRTWKDRNINETGTSEKTSEKPKSAVEGGGDTR